MATTATETGSFAGAGAAAVGPLTAYVAPGSILQFVFQISVSALFLILLYAVSPYSASANHLLAVVAQWSTLVVAFGGLLTKINVAPSGEEAYSQQVLDGFVVASALAPLVVAVVQTVVDLATDHSRAIIVSHLGCCCPRARRRAAAELAEYDALRDAVIADRRARAKNDAVGAVAA